VKLKKEKGVINAVKRKRRINSTAFEITNITVCLKNQKISDI